MLDIDKIKETMRTQYSIPKMMVNSAIESMLVLLKEKESDKNVADLFWKWFPFLSTLTVLLTGTTTLLAQMSDFVENLISYLEDSEAERQNLVRQNEERARDVENLQKRIEALSHADSSPNGAVQLPALSWWNIPHNVKFLALVGGSKREGSKIEAIKLLRNLYTSLSLAQAKDLVEAWVRSELAESYKRKAFDWALENVHTVGQAGESMTSFNDLAESWIRYGASLALPYHLFRDRV